MGCEVSGVALGYGAARGQQLWSLLGEEVGERRDAGLEEGGGQPGIAPVGPAH